MLNLQAELIFSLRTNPLLLNLERLLDTYQTLDLVYFSRVLLARDLEHQIYCTYVSRRGIFPGREMLRQFVEY